MLIAIIISFFSGAFVALLSVAILAAKGEADKTAENEGITNGRFNKWI